MVGIKCYKPTAAFYNIVELPVEDAAAFCQWMLTDFRHMDRTVMFSPANGFYFNKALGKQQIRIAFVLNEDKLNLAMDCVERGWWNIGKWRVETSVSCRYFTPDPDLLKWKIEMSLLYIQFRGQLGY